MVNIDMPRLALAMEAGIGLLVEFEAPIGTEPDDIVTAVLEIEAMAGGGGMCEKDRDCAFVPLLEYLGI